MKGVYVLGWIFTSTIFDNEWWVLQESLLKLSLSGALQISPPPAPLHLGNYLCSGASSLKSPVQRKTCFVPSRSLMSSLTENMYVIFCSWKSGPYAFYITLSYFWVREKQGLLDHSQSDITLKSGGFFFPCSRPQTAISPKHIIPLKFLYHAV